MKTEFGKWLMDIAKYMVTALLKRVKTKKDEYINSCRIYFANSHRRYFIF